jgi:hypothetical protein
MLKTKSVWNPINRQADGLRILVTRIRGRGLPASQYDVRVSPASHAETQSQRPAVAATVLSSQYLS